MQYKLFAQLLVVIGIKAAYKKMALKYHLDKNTDAEFAHKKMIEINNVYDVLKDEALRAEYDQSIRYGLSEKNQQQSYRQQNNNQNHHNTKKYEYKKDEFVGKTNAFKFAATGNLEDFKKELKTNAASASAENDEEESPLSTAFHHNYILIINLLLEHNAKFSLYDFSREDASFSKDLTQKLKNFCSSHKLLCHDTFHYVDTIGGSSLVYDMILTD